MTEKLSDAICEMLKARDEFNPDYFGKQPAREIYEAAENKVFTLVEQLEADSELLNGLIEMIALGTHVSITDGKQWYSFANSVSPRATLEAAVRKWRESK
jgi:hypothetical protein